MNDGLKQRIIGAMVLVALGIIFIPVIFDKERIVPVDRTSQIPKEPDIVAIPLPEPPIAPRPKLPEIAQPIEGDFRAQTEEEIEKAIEKPPEKKRNAPLSLAQSEPKVSAWVLQVASYKDSKRAAALRDKLIAQGEQAFIKQVHTSSGERTRLYLGPTIDKPALDKAKVKVDKRYGVDSIVLRYKP